MVMSPKMWTFVVVIVLYDKLNTFFVFGLFLESVKHYEVITLGISTMSSHFKDPTLTKYNHQFPPDSTWREVTSRLMERDRQLKV